jgi:hypothetical protein
MFIKRYVLSQHAKQGAAPSESPVTVNGLMATGKGRMTNW